jgi:hypothetical protein
MSQPYFATLTDSILSATLISTKSNMVTIATLLTATTFNFGINTANEA